MVRAGQVRAGQRVLVHGAAGGVGHLAVQIAKARGAHVIGTARAAKHDFLRALGADELIDHTTEDFTRVRDVDVVLDTVSGDVGCGRSSPSSPRQATSPLSPRWWTGTACARTWRRHCR